MGTVPCLPSKRISRLFSEQVHLQRTLWGLQREMKFSLVLVFLCVQVYGAPPVMTSIGSFHQVAEVNPLEVKALSDILARVKRSPVPFRSFGRGRGRGHHGRGRGWGRGRGGRGRPFGGINFGSTLTAGAIGFGAGFLANGLFG